ncbi:hypothetical protein B4U80_14307 [Leptotrombidium deliense]|uniref:Uncharacterized protein n=1 Tax=Leptotrombidium deliense TaxID=299467 RepID=A0A443RXX7_9ACAR|nr:hypothetical protein B4U80_14307 [Leptotrombidium deliense]
MNINEVIVDIFIDELIHFMPLYYNEQSKTDFINLVDCFLCCQNLYARHIHAAHFLSRHGDRSPAVQELLPNQPYSDLKYWPMGYGQLTNVKNFLRTVLQFWCSHRLERIECTTLEII